MKTITGTNKRRALYIAVSTGLIMTCVGPGVWAQSEDAITLEKLEVTGSRIKRTEYEGALPVAVFDREYIERSGSSTVTELVKKVIYNNAGVRDETFTQGFAPASAAVDLRGLGVNRTLVLVNGRRVPLFPFAQDGSASFVDINLIPLSAVERIEILKDGASAVYGSDAIAGVVNIILRKDYEGAELSLQVGGTGEGDGEEGHISAVGGISNERGNLTFIADFFDRDKVMAKDRDISKSAFGPIDDRSLVGDPGTAIRLAMGGMPVPDPRCPASSIDPERGPFCLYDFAPWVTLIPEARRLGFVASGEYELKDNLSVFFGANYTDSDSERDLAPSTGGFFVDPGNPNNPYPGEPVIAVRRLTELGPRTDKFETDAWNLVGGLRGDIGAWDWELGVGGGKIDSTIKGTNGYTTQDAVEEAIANGSLNPFGTNPGFNPASISYETRRDGESSLFFTDLKATGDILEMRHGALSAAVGAEYRSEDFSDKWDPLSEAGDILAVGGTSSDGDRNVWALYAELNIPVLSTLEVDLAARYDDYSDFGGTLNPKLALRWKPLTNVLVRGSAGTGFKAPSLPELYSGEIAGFAGVFDPATGEVTEVDTLTSGNPDLDAEDSKNYGLGLVWDTNEIMSLSVDWWRIEIDDAVSNDPQFYVDNEDLYPDNVIRGPGGGIVEVLNPFQNISEQNAWGLDFGADVNWTTQSAGDFGINFMAAYLGQFEQTPVPGADEEKLAGSDGRPRWRWQGALTWEKSEYKGSLVLNYIGDYERRLEGRSNDRVESWTTVDARFDWAPPALKGGALSLGINNLFDEEPPEDPYLEGWPFYNRDLYSARGRFFYAQYKHELK